MEDSETKTCSNCNRDIPAVNFLVHSIHCARNIRVCPVCKEPVQQQDLDDHHQKFHQLLPCKQCGESVCGTDLEDHIRDSCANTIKPCRYCELEIPRREIPAHENYCGSRTEQCPDCREWVLIKYRQLHVESNHGFIKLDDEPPPMPRVNNTPKSPKMTYTSANQINQNGVRSATSNGILSPNGTSTATQAKNNFLNMPTTSSNFPNVVPTTSSNFPNVVPKKSLTKPTKTASNVMGAQIKKEQPGPSKPDKSPVRYLTRADLLPIIPDPYAWSDPSPNTLERRLEEAARRSQAQVCRSRISQVNGGTRKKEIRVKKSAAPPPPNPVRDRVLQSTEARLTNEQRIRDDTNRRNAALGLPPVLSAAEKLERLRKMDALHNREAETKDYRNVLQGRVWRRPEVADVGRPLGRGSGCGGVELSGLTPMSEEEFQWRLEQLRLEEPRERHDRFSQIKSGLTHLRRELNEVTAPYNTNRANGSTSSSRLKPVRPANPGVALSPVRLPCEFCGMLVPEHNLLLHQTACRSEAGAACAQEVHVIPCEFCTESLPVHRLQKHQEKCRRRTNRDFPEDCGRCGGGEDSSD